MDANFIWPTREDYEFSMKNLDSMAQDERIRAGRVKVDQYNNISKVGGAGLYTSTFQITTANERHRYSRSLSSDWMVRCFCTTPKGKPPTDIGERYQKISAFCKDYLKNHDEETAPLLPVEYVEQAIKVYYLDDSGNSRPQGANVPVVKMPYIEARSLGDFIATKNAQFETMRQLCIAWLAMIRELERIRFAHGDLDLTNVLVLEKGSQLILKLIDYDNVWIPGLDGRSNPERGHPPFQHPMFFAPTNLPRPYNAEMDRFSALSIYISIRAIGLKPHLYKEFGADETNRLLFSTEDYRKVIEAPNESRVIQLLHMGMKDVNPYLYELVTTLREHKPGYAPCSLDTVPLLPDEIISWDDKPSPAVRPSTSSGYTTRPSTPLPEDASAQTPRQPYHPAARKPLLTGKALLVILIVLVILIIIVVVAINSNNSPPVPPSSTPAYLLLRHLATHLPTASPGAAPTIMEGGI